VKNKKRILFFGLGSIGIKHLKLIKKNFDYDLYAYRTKKQPILGIKNIYDINEAFQIDADIAFITNPTYLHVETILLCLESGINNLFIEKPLSNDLNNLDKVLKETEKSEAIVYVAYTLRHNPILKRLKSIVDEIKDQIFYTITCCSSYLPNWRPERDYREIYSSKEAEGGGVILDLSHEFDYNEWLFGKIISINGIYGKISSLEIDSEDFCDANLTFKNNIIGTIHLDYFSYKPQRFIKILTFEEEIIADLIRKEIIRFKDNDKKIESFKFERDFEYETQLYYFLNGVENQDININNLKQSKELLEKLLKFKKNAKRIEINKKNL